MSITTFVVNRDQDGQRPARSFDVFWTDAGEQCGINRRARARLRLRGGPSALGERDRQFATVPRVHIARQVPARDQRVDELPRGLLAKLQLVNELAERAAAGLARESYFGRGLPQWELQSRDSICWFITVYLHLFRRLQCSISSVRSSA